MSIIGTISTEASSARFRVKFMRVPRRRQPRGAHAKGANAAPVTKLSRSFPYVGPSVGTTWDRLNPAVRWVSMTRPSRR